ncbi:hypothetical protein [Dactylosporangium sp. NPDC048998]|uniref:hypothetical protein n=1 Tax=Dactylosporangium sp. NPDC048998 TaxID=3363976 RepID=UPI00370FE708
MSQPAPITSRADWDDVVDALQETVDDIRDLRADFQQRQTEQGGDQVTDPDYDEQELDDERRRRDEELDADADGRVDGNYDPDLDDR